MTQITMPELSRVDPKWLRNVLGCFATGVAVVTVASELGPVGVTANSFTSVSLAPPLVLFCVANSSRSLGPIKRAKAFAVNILGKGQERVSRTLAAKIDNRFAEVATAPTPPARRSWPMRSRSSPARSRRASSAVTT